MATYPVSLTLTAPAGTINTALTESIWLGSTYFLSVFTTTGTVATTAALTALTNDPYTTGNTQTQVSTTSLGTFTPLDRPMLIRLDYNRVLMFYSQTNKSLSYNHFNSSETLAINAMVLEVVSNVISVVYSGTNVAYGGMMNWINSADSGYYLQPTATKANTAAFVWINGSSNYGSVAGYTCGYSNSSYLWLTANRVLCCMRDSHLYTNGTNTGITTQPVYCQLFDISYASTSGTTGPGTLTITQRYKDAGTTYGSSALQSSYYFNFAGPNDVPYIYAIPGTTQVVFGFTNDDPTLGTSHRAFTTDAYTTATSSTAFITGNSAYVADYTQVATTWTIASTISTRRGSVLAPLDSTRFIEVNNQVCTAGTTVYSRVYNSSTATWTTDIPTEYTLNTANNAANALNFGTCNQITLLGNDFMLLSFNNRSNGLSYYGIFALVGNTVLRSIALGAVALAPLTFQRGFDAIILRSVNDPNQTSPYQFFGKTSNLGYTFLQYLNPT